MNINTNNKINLDENKWVTLDVASKKQTIYSKRQIHKLAAKGNERIGTKKLANGQVLYNFKHILQYASAHHAVPILDPVWDEIDYIAGEAFYPLFGYDCKYYISDRLRVIDASNGQVITVSPPNEKGYRQVKLMQYGKRVTEYLHRLVGQTQCPNVLGRNIFHHIKLCNPANDKPANILPVWKWQHDELHKLLRENKMSEYKELVAKIKRENSQKLYRIPHLDFKPDEKYNYYMWVTADGYKAYRAGKDIPFGSIVRETAERKGVTNG